MLSPELVHEIKTPIAIIRGYAATLLERDVPDDKRRWFLDVIERQSRALSEKIDRLEDLQALEKAPTRGSTDIGPILRAAVEGLEVSNADLRSVEGTAVRGSTGWLLRAIEQAILAVREANADSGTIEVRATQRGSTVSVTAAGSGRERPKGLGLELARKVAERFGGGITVRPGKVTVRLIRAGGAVSG